MNIKIGKLYKIGSDFDGILGNVPVTLKKYKDSFVILLNISKIKDITKKQFISYPLFYFVSSVFIYEGKARIDILDIKINGNLKKIPFFIEKLCQIYMDNPVLSTIDVIIPCPHSSDNKIELTKMLCVGLSKNINKPVLLNILQRVRNLEKTQVYLSPKERLENVKGAFTIDKKEQVRNKICLLIDDIITTGATANECSNLLLSAGTKKIYLITIAKPLNSVFI
ncbi:MAG: hypothetical protein M1135_03390 [Candidatus Omnitrophica bacterium]|nr:hypothetical protein [Candidatus Omnitrophota bacterium]